MSAPKETIWAIEPHTRAKHEILKRYLQAWLPILTQHGFPEILYVDGFAGPGKYIGNEDGSPIIALKAAIEQQQTIGSTVFFRFIEKDADRSSFLTNLVNSLQLPSRFDVKVKGGREFAEAFDEILTKLEKRGKFPPTFAFIDPFGWTGVPFTLITRLMQNASCEVMITFMYEEINRFITLPSQEAKFDQFFGTGKNEWRPGVGISQPQARGRFFHDLYVKQLRNVANIQFVRSFEMRNDNDVIDYFLFYGTNSKAGLKKMKEAMWKIDQSGEFRFSDATDPNQMVLFGSDTTNRVLELITKNFKGRQATVGEIEDYVLRETPYRETHYKGVLKQLELAQPAKVEVIDAPIGRRRGTFPIPSLKIRFS